MSSVRRWGPLLAVVFLPLVYLGGILVGGRAIGPWDQIRQMAPWSEETRAQPWDVLQADGALQFHGWRDLVFESWSRGEVPAWNPYQLGGTPLLANSQSGALYPPHILFGVARIPTETAVTLLAWLHLAWAGLGVFVLARRLGAGEAASAAAGVLFGSSTFLILWLPLASVPTTCAWIPWLLAGVLGLFAEEARTRFRFAALTAVSLGMLLTAGHLQFAAYGALAALVLGLWLVAARAFSEAKSGPAGRPTWPVALGLGLVAAVAGILLASPHLLPVLSESGNSHRRNVPTSEGYAAYIAGAVAPWEVLGLAVPYAYGSTAAPNPTYAGISTYWPALVKRGAHPAEAALALGPLVLLGLAALPWRAAVRRPEGAFVGIGVLSLLLAVGTPLNALLYFGVPGWSSTGSPGRIAVLFVLSGCVLAALGFDRLLREPPAPRQRNGLIAIPVLFVLLGIVGPWYASPTQAWVPGIPPEAIAKMQLQPAPGLIALVVLGAALVPTLARKPELRLGGIAGGAVLSVLALGPASGGPLVRSGESIRPDAGWDALIDRTDRVAAINLPWDLVLAAPAVLPPNTATLTRIRDIAGYDSLMHRDSYELLREISGDDPAPPANGNIAFVKPTADFARLADAGVTRVLSPRPISGLEELGNLGSAIVYRLPGPGRVSADGGDARIVEESPGRIVVEWSGTGRLTVRERALDGWTVRIGGSTRPVPSGRWLEIEPGAPAPEGTVRVEFRYAPPRLSQGLAAAAVGLALSATLAGLGWRRQNADPASSPDS
ncbi:MAG: hypothetical protein SNJ61_12815 [Fimbriimonadaceae bacterium]